MAKHRKISNRYVREVYHHSFNFLDGKYGVWKPWSISINQWVVFYQYMFYAKNGFYHTKSSDKPSKPTTQTSINQLFFLTFFTFSCTNLFSILIIVTYLFSLAIWPPLTMFRWLNTQNSRHITFIGISNQNRIQMLGLTPRKTKIILFIFCVYSII